MSGGAFTRARNGRAIDRAAIPDLPLADFRREIIEGTRQRERLSALFGGPCSSGGARLWAVLASDQEGVLRLGSTVVPGDSSLEVPGWPSCFRSPWVRSLTG